ncbi:Unknown protein sequence [Pseudomonas syringae pv. maculicola]|nr:Unknown protein sequence [Pseudomonas syringae pv. maculicola]
MSLQAGAQLTYKFSRPLVAFDAARAAEKAATAGCHTLSATHQALGRT